MKLFAVDDESYDEEGTFVFQLAARPNSRSSDSRPAFSFSTCESISSPQSWAMLFKRYRCSGHSGRDRESCATLALHGLSDFGSLRWDNNGSVTTNRSRFP